MSAETQNSQDQKQVVFVCTGNVFRSLTAEFAARAAHEPAKDGLKLAFASAGIRGRPEKPVRDDVKARAAHWNLDVSAHLSRKLTQDIMDAADLIIAMDSKHQQAIKDEFGVDVPLYLEIAEGRSEDILDLPDVMTDFHKKPKEAEAFIIGVMDRIVANKPRFLANLPNFIK